MEINGKAGEDNTESKKPRIKLRFTCPKCGGRDLRLTLLCAFYPTSTLDCLEVDPDSLEDSELQEREPFGEHCSSGNDGWEFQCADCGAVPMLEKDGEEQIVDDEEELAEWLLKHCPQGDEDQPVNADELKGD